MKTINSECIIFCDVDDTLIMWDKEDKTRVLVTNPHDGMSKYLSYNQGNIKILKDRKARGAFIVVWSAGGYKWAEEVVKALRLEEHVDMIMSKPYGYVDDKPAEKIMGEHIYIPFESNYGK